MIKKISLLGLLGLLFVSYSYAATSWTYYQVRASVYSSHKRDIDYQLFNNNLSSSYYIDKGSISDGQSITKKEGEIIVFVVEQGQFQPLSGFTVTDYNGYYDYFTAIYKGQDFARQICNNFGNGYLKISKNSSKLYKNLNVGGVTKTIKIASTDTGMILLDDKIKISGGYTNCNNPISSPLSYTAVYSTKYYYDVSHPKLGDISYTDENGNTYNPSNGWINKNVNYKVYLVDRPVGVANSGPKKDYLIGMINNQQLRSDPLKITTEDNLGNKGTESIAIAIPIDKQTPILKDNNIKLSGVIGQLNYLFDKSSSNKVILADKYNVKFTLKDPGTNCDTIDTNCKQVSGIKTVTIKVDGNSICTKNFPPYNPSYTKKDADIKYINCNNIDFTQDKDYTLNLHFEDNAGNKQDITWNINVEPNKPDPNKFVINCSDCSTDKYSTNENDDKYSFNYILKDHWGNRITKPVKSVELTSGSYIDTDTYDGNNSDDGNIVEKINEKLGMGTGSFSLRSIVPGTIKDKFKFTIQGYDKYYNDISTDFVYYKDFGNTYNYKEAITTGDIWIEDSSGNNIPFTGMLPNTEYIVNFKVKVNGFDNNDYSYKIDKDDLLNSIKLYPQDYYKLIYTGGVQNNVKNSGATPKTIKFTIEYEFIGNGSMDKEIGISFNPSITIRNNGKEGKYSIGTYTFGDSSVEKKFPFKVIGYKSNVGNSSTIGESIEVNLTKNSSFKTNIRKKAFYLSNSLKDGEISNGIFYKVGDYSLTRSKYSRLISAGVNTIIIKNGNLKILTNIENRLDIAVISDNTNYDMYSSIDAYKEYLKNGGNIIIGSNVSIINGVLFADKSLFAGKDDGEPISPYSSKRAAILKKQLIFYGSLISRNTIGGSIQKDGKYVMPGGKKVKNTNSNLRLALAFDLAFFRLGNEGYSSSLNKKYNEGNKENVLVIYNPDLRIHPHYLLK